MVVTSVKLLSKPRLFQLMWPVTTKSTSTPLIILFLISSIMWLDTPLTIIGFNRLLVTSLLMINTNLVAL